MQTPGLWFESRLPRVGLWFYALSFLFPHRFWPENINVSLSMCSAHMLSEVLCKSAFQRIDEVQIGCFELEFLLYHSSSLCILF